jgi:signal transduction histidine kinase/CheY-like chemotaxis protein
MVEESGTRPALDGALRFQLTVQRSRLAAMLMMGLVAAVARAAGIVQFDLVGAGLALLLGVSSVFLCRAIYRLAARRGRRWPLHHGWMAFDLLLICWTIWLVHDSMPLWMIWLLTNTAAAAFVAGRRAARVVMWASVVAYLATLVLMGEIRGLDRQLAFAVGRLALLFGASYYMIGGIADLRDKRKRISELDAEKSQRLEELHRLAEELDRRTRELAGANRRIQDANRAKSRFLASMSHELRTPLNSIIGFSEILTDKLAGRIEPRFEKFLANIVTSGRHLLGLINNILDLSKIEAGRMELVFEAVSIGDVVHGVASVMHGMAAQRNVALETEVADALPPVVADVPRVKQILYNLVSNAIKFSEPGSRVHVRAGLVAADASPLGERSLVLAVEDQGHGIRREDQDLIFEEFRQVDGDLTRNMGGTGLGLALVKRFAEMHGGRVTVESEPGRGSIFRVFLPFDASRQGTPRLGEPLSFGFTVSEVSSAVGSGSGPCILVAEDDDEFARVLAADLEASGYRTLRARTGNETIALARHHLPAAITLDLVLPGKDGWEVLQALKADAATARIPVVVISLVANHELGFALGAADYFVKPLDRDRFLDRLHALVPIDARAARPTVLVVDDDPQVHDFLGLQLDEAGYDVLGARSGREALALAVAHLPAAIVLDLIMDGMDGFQTAAELQRLEATRAIPILVFTTKEISEDDRRRLAGAAGVLSKAPEDRRRLLAAIRELAGRPADREGPGAARLGG